MKDKNETTEKYSKSRLRIGSSGEVNKPTQSATEDAAQSSSKVQLYKDYARAGKPFKNYTPEHPKTRGMKILQRLWSKIRPSLVKRGIVEVPEDVPSDVGKWAVMPDWLEKFEAHPIKGRNVFEWLDSWVPDKGVTFRNGAMTLRRLKAHETARLKQFGQGMNDPRPAFTFHGNRIDLDAFKDRLVSECNRAKAAGRYPNNALFDLDMESLEKWDSWMGGRCGTYVLAESSILFHGMTPHQESASPIPVDVFWDSWRFALQREFPSAVEAPPLKPKHFFVSVGYGPGMRINNKKGATGYPFPNKTPDEIREILGRPKFSGRPTKGVVFNSQMTHLTNWIVAGMPMRGELYSHVAQPATLTFRGDRAVDRNIRALGVRGPQAEYHEAADQLAAILPGRSVIIVPTVLVLAQSTWAQPLGDHIADVAAPGFDWVDPDHTMERLSEIRRTDLTQAGEGKVASVGADASGWDRDVTGQMHVGEAAWYCKMFPKNARLLHVDSDLPIEVDDAWVAEQLGKLQDGEETTLEVTQMVDDGSTRVGPVKVRSISFDYHEFICKVMTMVNDAPIRWANYEVDGPGQEFSLAGADPEFKGLSIYSNGGRRSGDAATGIGNSWSNLVVSY